MRRRVTAEPTFPCSSTVVTQSASGCCPPFNVDIDHRQPRVSAPRTPVNSDVQFVLISSVEREWLGNLFAKPRLIRRASIQRSVRPRTVVPVRKRIDPPLHASQVDRQQRESHPQPKRPEPSFELPVHGRTADAAMNDFDVVIFHRALERLAELATMIGDDVLGCPKAFIVCASSRIMRSAVGALP